MREWDLPELYLDHPRELAVLCAGPVQYPELGAERVLLFLERAAALSGGNCIKLGLPGKSILGYYFQENRGVFLK